MPIADFPGRFGWGYDGVNFFAPTWLYGQPDDLRRFVDEAHAQNLGVILDVVYNHVGPDGNFLKSFASDYFTSRHQTDWGEAINFDGKTRSPFASSSSPTRHIGLTSSTSMDFGWMPRKTFTTGQRPTYWQRSPEKRERRQENEILS